MEVRRSARRSRTVTAFREDGRLVVAIPAGFTLEQEHEWVHRMATRVVRSEQRLRPSDDDLARRAAELSSTYLGGWARPASVVWVSNQGRRWGSCTPSRRTIRLSDRLQGFPGWVQDYVLLHELVHLVHSGHGPEFWAALDVYPRADRARGFLEGVAHVDAAGPGGDADSDGPDADGDGVDDGPDA